MMMKKWVPYAFVLFEWVLYVGSGFLVFVFHMAHFFNVLYIDMDYEEPILFANIESLLWIAIVAGIFIVYNRFSLQRDLFSHLILRKAWLIVLVLNLMGFAINTMYILNSYSNGTDLAYYIFYTILSMALIVGVRNRNRLLKKGRYFSNV